jgi:hypothetical protein
MYEPQRLGRASQNGELRNEATTFFVFIQKVDLSMSACLSLLLMGGPNPKRIQHLRVRDGGVIERLRFLGEGQRLS